MSYRPRFLSTRPALLVLIAATLVVCLWVAAVGWALVDLLRLIAGGGKACS